MPEQQFYTVAEVAELLRVSESTIRNYIRRGYIKAIKFGMERRATVRIPKSEIESLYANGMRQPEKEAQEEEE